MKKTITLLMILCLIISSFSFAEPQVKIFTHPEIGEQMTVGFENGNRPYFQIYGYYYYRFMGVNDSYRGLQAIKDYNNIDAQINQSKAIKSILTDIEADKSIKSVSFFTGSNEINDIVKNLSIEEKIEFLDALYGFKGIDGYNKLEQNKEIKQVIEQLKENYFEYSVKINDIIYPFRAFMLYIEGEKLEDSYFERYSFVKSNDEWHLLNITREYTNEYKERSKYVHGLASIEKISTKDIVEATIGSNIDFKTTKNEFSKLIESKINNNSVTIKDDEIFGLYTDSTYEFDNDTLSKITYTFANLESYYSCFISLYTRFTEPCIINNDGTMVWSTNDLLMTLSPVGAFPKLEITAIK